MNRASKYGQKASIKDLFDEIENSFYTRETLASVFRCFLETIIENRYPSVILAKLKDTSAFQGLLGRLKFTESKVYVYSENIEGFNQVITKHQGVENDEFLIIVAERFSACVSWSETQIDKSGLCEGFCSVNPEDIKKITEFLQDIAYDKNLEKDFLKILQDRRNNEKFTSIIRKLVENLESTHRDLICSNKELEELSEKRISAKAISSIAHEIRNPLGMIALHSKLISKVLEKKAFNNEENIETLAKSSQTIINTIENLEGLLTELVEFTKAEQLELQEDDVNKTLQNLVELATPLFKEKNVNIVYENITKSPTILIIDRKKISQCLLNLVKNALEVSKAGDTVKIELKNNDNQTIINVSDQGYGIDQENISKLFSPYFSTKKNGTGLGLARTKKIIEAHGGKLLLDKTGKNGTTFSLNFLKQKES